MKTCISLAALAFSFASPTLVTAAPAPSGAAAMLLDRVAIDSVIDTYFYNLDHGHTDKLSALYTDDGIMAVEGQGDIKGHAAIDEYYSHRAADHITRHVVTNLYIEFIDANHAHAIHTLTYYLGQGAGPFPATPTGVADYVEDLRREANGQWRFTYRKPTPIFGFRPKAATPAK
jgi:ketosteroid isomerase-like protein